MLVKSAHRSGIDCAGGERAGRNIGEGKAMHYALLAGMSLTIVLAMWVIWQATP